MKIAKKQVLSFIILAAFSLIAISTAMPARADQSLLDTQIGLNSVGQAYGNSTPVDIRITIAKIINLILGFLGIIFVVLTIVAGFQYMTSAGNEEKVKKAVGLLKNAIIGLVIVLLAWAVTRFVINRLTRAINNSIDYMTLPY